MSSPDTGDEIYIALVDVNGVESVERRLNANHERGKTEEFTICTPQDENIGELKFIELHQRSKDSWYMDKVMICNPESGFIRIPLRLQPSIHKSF